MSGWVLTGCWIGGLWAEACGHDPLEGLTWIAGSWREQDSYTALAS
ncbi:hypothetical protein [Streptomyces nodosus]|nr:hypothetical protein [Streptomyces nodosus]MBB4795142.1 hypothetical protein [Streptomyces nodosus]